MQIIQVNKNTHVYKFTLIKVNDELQPVSISFDY